MPKYNIVIKNARIIDGTGSPWQRGDVAINNGKITDIGIIRTRHASLVIDAEDRVLSPGFIDIHTHADRDAERLPLMENYLRQGVTTLLGGNCGYSSFPINNHLGRMKKLSMAINYGLFVGHGSIRKEAMGLSMRAPTAAELGKMKKLAVKAMRDGAFGMSLGLYYAPGSYAELDEVVAISREVGKQGRLITIHIRDESDYTIGLVDSVKEAIAIAEQANAPVHIAHLKCLGKSVWGKSQKLLDLIDEARQRNIDVTFDQYPYTASGTSFTGAIIPRWALDGGEEALATRLKDPAERSKIRIEMLKNIERRGGPSALFIALYEPDQTLNGKNLEEVGQILGMEPVDAAITMQIEDGARLVSFNMVEEDLHTIMKHPAGMFASDGSLVALGEGVPHPRYYGTFPRFLARYVREQKVITLEEAVRRMTSAPARRVGLWKRGLIAKGMNADLVLFDPQSIADTATFSAPHSYPNGIGLVIVNGEVAFDGTRMTKKRAGRVLRRP